MSLINQVLNDLEKRGASTNIGEATIRVVPKQKSDTLFWLIFIVLSSVVFFGLIWVLLGSGLQIFENTADVPVVQSSPVEVPAETKQIVAAAAPAAEKLVINPDKTEEVINKPLVKMPPVISATKPNIPLEKNQVQVKIVPNKLEVPTLPRTAPVKIPDKINEKPKAATMVKPPAVLPDGGISKQATQTTPQQQAENEYRKAYGLMQQGQLIAAVSGFETTLQLDVGHLQARQTLVRLLLEQKRIVDAEKILHEGLQHDPKQSSFALLLARIQVGRNELAPALETMQRTLPYAEKQADYLAFVAALLQRLNRHHEAVDFYQKALRLNSQSGVWLMGMGISLRAEQRGEEAKDAFNRALESKSLNGELQLFVTQQLKELSN